MNNEQIDNYEMQEVPQPAADHNQEQQLNAFIAQGFGNMFLNLNDPETKNKNIPIKEESQKHLNCIIATIILAIMLGVGLGGYKKFVNIGGTIAICVSGYIVYLLISLFFSKISGYINNLKKFEDYEQTYSNMTKGKGYFVFWIECYHYVTVRTKKGTRRQKRVTHTATKNYYPIDCVDQSGQLQGINDISKYVFLRYQKKFFFTDTNSQYNFNSDFSNFVSRNRRDIHQNYNHTFHIQNFEQEVGFTAMGEGCHNCLLFIIFHILGLSLPYSFVIQKSVSRYTLNIVKRLTC